MAELLRVAAPQHFALALELPSTGLHTVIHGGEVVSTVAFRIVAGILLVTAGIYCVGLQPGESALEPLRALKRSRASWYAIGAPLFWTMTTLLHKIGIAEVGPFPWAVTLALGSGFG